MSVAAIHVFRVAHQEVPQALLDQQPALRDANKLENNEAHKEASSNTNSKIRPLMERNEGPKGGDLQKYSAGKRVVESPPRKGASPELEVIAVKPAPKDLSRGTADAEPSSQNKQGPSAAKKQRLKLTPPPPKTNKHTIESRLNQRIPHILNC